MNHRWRTWTGRLAAAAITFGTPAALGVAALAPASCAKETAAATRYHCPMHPTYVSDKPGDCPICGMHLVPIDEGPSSGPAGPAPAPAPQAREDAAPTGVPGLAIVRTTDEGRRLAGTQTAVARRERIARTIRTVGTVVADETRVQHVHTRIPGWIDRLYVDFTGRAVRKGEPLLALYSPELLASQEEYLRAREAARQLQGSSLPEVRTGADELVRASRRRLELFDVPEGFIAQLDRTGKPRRAVPLLAPSSGVVTARQAYEGRQVDPGMDLFTITDLSHVWIEADLYEEDASRVRVGDDAVLTLAYDPKARLTGRVRYVYPYLDPQTRTLKVRFDVANPDGTLKPAMFANVELALEAADGVVVPDTAVMDTGLRQVVFVGGPDGTFAPRPVKVGLRADGRAEILDGLKEGERVATAAAFLLDSESRLRSALAAAPAGMGGHDGHAPEPPAGPGARP